MVHLPAKSVPVFLSGMFDDDDDDDELFCGMADL